MPVRKEDECILGFMYLIHTKYTLDIVGEETNEMTPEEANGITQAHIAIDKKITYEEVSSMVISNMGMRT